MTNVKVSMTNVKDEKPRRYDLGERTAVFGEEIVRFCKGVERSVVATPIVGQLVRAGTSIGANYAEADGAASKKDFLHKISICRKEAKETFYWPRMITQATSVDEPRRLALSREAHELSLIFSAILRKGKSPPL